MMTFLAKYLIYPLLAIAVFGLFAGAVVWSLWEAGRNLMTSRPP